MKKLVLLLLIAAMNVCAWADVTPGIIETTTVGTDVVFKVYGDLTTVTFPKVDPNGYIYSESASDKVVIYYHDYNKFFATPGNNVDESHKSILRLKVTNSVPINIATDDTYVNATKTYSFNSTAKTNLYVGVGTEAGRDHNIPYYEHYTKVTIYDVPNTNAVAWYDYNGPAYTQYYIYNGENYECVPVSELNSYLKVNVSSASWKYWEDGSVIKDSEGNEVTRGTPIDLEKTYTRYYDSYDPVTLDELVALGYVIAPSYSFGEFLALQVQTNSYTSVKLEAYDNTTPIIAQDVPRLLVQQPTVLTLDLGDVQIDEIKPSNNGHAYLTDGTFYCSGDNKTLTKLVMPSIMNATKKVNEHEHRHVPTYTGTCLTALEELILPDNATCIEADAFGSLDKLHKVVFKNEVERIGYHAFYAARLGALTIPASVKYIAEGAFGAGFLSDVYFLGLTAPIVEMDAFGSKAYLNNNSVTDPTHAPEIAPEEYLFTRNDYTRKENGNDYAAALLHLPSGMTAAQRAAYTDITRDYHVFDYWVKESGAVKTKGEHLISASPLNTLNTVQKVQEDGNGEFTLACNGNFEDKTSIGSKSFGVYGNNLFNSGIPGDWGTYKKNTGFYDKHVGNQYQWPSQAQMTRAYSVATNNLLWDGTTTIGQGISKARTGVDATFDADCDGTDEKSYTDGEQYIGLHQFILVTYDVSGDDPEEYPFPTIGGANWYTICVPLHISVAEVRKAFGEYTQVCKFNKVVRDVNSKIKLFFTEETCLGHDEEDRAIEANYPYMIRPSSAKGTDDHTFTLPNFTLQFPEIPVEVTLTAVDENENPTSYKYTFVGQNKTNPITGAPLYMNKYDYYLGAVSGSSPEIHKLFMQVGTTGKWKPHTCIVQPSDGKADYDSFFDPNRPNIDVQNKAKGTNCVFGLDDYEGVSNSNPTGVCEVYCGSNNTPAFVYGVGGQYIGNNADKLRSGLYIQDGKKFIVK